MDFSRFVADIENHGWNVHGVQVYKHGDLRHQWGDINGLYPIYSATKSILSIAMGIAADEGRLDLNASVLNYLPQEAVSQLSPAQQQAFAPITLHRLMCMSVKGFPFRAEGDDWLQFALHCPLCEPDTPAFDYSNISAYLAGIALTHAMGMDAGQLIEERILEPLGITDYRLGRCPAGYFYGASKMELSVESLCKIGLLMAGGGVFHGQRIVSEAYVQAATALQQQNREGGYGYFFWKYRDGFSINGKWKQKCYVLPKDELVIGYLSHIEEETSELKVSMERHLLGICE